MWWPVASGKSRKRKRSKSQPVRIRRLKRRHDSASTSGGPVKPLQIFYRSLNPDVTESFVLEISSDEVEFFSKVDYSFVHISHNHSSSSSTAADEKFPRIRPLDSKYLCSISQLPDKIPCGNAVVIGSTVYACYYGRILTLDLDYKPPHPDIHQLFGQVPLPPSCPPPRDYAAKIGLNPKLIALRGRLYFFCGNDKPFGEVYNPRTKSWSALKEPAGVNLTTCLIHFIASLGESKAEILFYLVEDKDDMWSPSRIYIYNVRSRKWRTLSCTPEFDLAEPKDWFLVGEKALVKEDQHQNNTTMYWLDRRSMLYAFNWETLQLSHGQVVGMEHENLSVMLRSNIDQYSFFHVSGDLFCLAWSHDRDAHHTDFHITFLRVIDDDPTPGELTAYVVGCIKYDIDGRHLCFDAFPV